MVSLNGNFHIFSYIFMEKPFRGTFGRKFIRLRARSQPQTYLSKTENEIKPTFYDYSQINVSLRKKTLSISSPKSSSAREHRYFEGKNHIKLRGNIYLLAASFCKYISSPSRLPFLIFLSFWINSHPFWRC